MNGSEFIERVKAAAENQNLEVRFVAKHGKGSHGRLYVGDRFTTVKDRKKEIGPGLLLKMLSDLGLTKKDII